MNKPFVYIMAAVTIILIIITFLTTHISEYRSYYVSKSMGIDMTVARSIRNDWIQYFGTLSGYKIGSWWMPIDEKKRPPLDAIVASALAVELSKIDDYSFKECHGTLSPLGYSFQICIRDIYPTRKYINIEYSNDGTLMKRYEFTQ